MPLSKIQSDILQIIARGRDPESYVAGATPLNRAASRFSSDVDLFHDREEWVEAAAEQDELFGFVLHPIDLAINKIMAAAGRREVRDIVDLVTIDQTILTLGALVWAAVEKSPGFTPEGLIAEIRRKLNHPRAEWENLAAAEPLDPVQVTTYLRAALDKAEAFVARMPTDKMGLVFIKDGKVVEPDPNRIDDYQMHAGRCGGHWPTDPEIQRAMLER